MMLANPIEAATQTASEAAKRRLLSRRGEPLFIADWERVLMIHFEALLKQNWAVVGRRAHDRRAFLTRRL